MGTRWRYLTAAALGVGIFVVLLLGDTLLAPLLPRINPDAYLWVAGILAAGAGGLAIGRRAKAISAQRLLGAGLGVAGFLVALVGVQLVLAASMGGAYDPALEAEVPINGTWDAQAAVSALEAQGYEAEATTWGAVVVHTTLDDGTRFGVYVVQPDAGPDEEAPPGEIRLQASYRPADRLDTSAEARQWPGEDRTRLEDHLEAFLEGFLASSGWQQAGEVTWEKSLAVA